MKPPLNSFVYEKCEAESAPLPPLPVFLTEHYAQCAEDIIVASLLRSIAFKRKIELGKERFLEIGGNHPISTSSTFLLTQHFGMTGVIVEANPNLLSDLRRIRCHDLIVHAAITPEDVTSTHLSVANMHELSSIDRNFLSCWNVPAEECAYIEVPAMRINKLFEENFSEKPPIYMSIDVEGVDLALLRDLDFERFRPPVVQAEPSDHYLPGNSEQIFEFMKSVDYELIGRTPVNLIFLDRRTIGGCV